MPMIVPPRSRFCWVNPGEGRFPRILKNFRDLILKGWEKAILKNYSGTVVESTSKEGQSYYRNGLVWADLYYFDETANFCIKGLANNRSEGLSNPMPWLPLLLLGQ